MKRIRAVLAAATTSIAAASETVYWDPGLFRELRGLAVELDGARLANLAPGGQALWESGGMRVPESAATTLTGDFTGGGREQRAALLESGEPGRKRFFLLVAEKQRRWRPLLVLELKKHLPGSLAWDGHRGALVVTTNRRRRRAKAASMTADGNGIRSMSPGYVIEETYVIAFKWETKRRRFEEIPPYWLELSK